MSIRKRLLGFLSLVCLLASVPAAAQTPTRAVVADSYANALHVFDWESNTLLGTVNIPDNPEVSPLSIQNCLITSDGTTAYVPDNFYRIWVVDLTTDPPELPMDGINPIIGSSVAEDIALTPDENYLLVAGRSTIGNYPPQVTPISCVDLATRTEVSTLMLPDGLPGVIEVCDDGTTVLASVSGSNGFVAKLTLDPDGTLTDTGLRSTTMFAAGTIAPIPGSRFAVIESGLDSGYGFHIIDVDDLSIVDTHELPGTWLVAAVASPSGDRLYIRSQGIQFEYEGPAMVEAFAFDQATGELGESPLYDIPADNVSGLNSTSPLATTPDGALLLVPMNPYVITNSPHDPIGDDARIDVFDTADGSLVKTLSFGGQIASPSGIDVSGPASALIEVTIDIVPGDPDNQINLARDKHVDVIAFGEETFDVTSVVPETVAFAGAPIQRHKKKGLTYWIEDANADGIDDLRTRFAVEELELTTSDTTALLSAETTGGDFVLGADSVSVVETRGRGKK